MAVGDLSNDDDDKSRMMGDCHVRFCERLEGKFPGSTRPYLAYWAIIFVVADNFFAGKHHSSIKLEVLF